MKRLRFLLKSRGISGIFFRVLSLLQRFGISPKRMEKNLIKIADICKEYGFSPTFPVTAVVLNRYPLLFKRLQKKGVEFAIHGLVHIDYKKLSYEKNREHIKRAIEMFKKENFDFYGYRPPYLRSNGTIKKVISEENFLWSSLKVVNWPVVFKDDFNPNDWDQYLKALDLYSPVSSSECRVIPRTRNGVVEVPVSMPDDEICVDRLNIKKNSGKISLLWQKILKETHRRGEIFTIQFHHERFPICGKSLQGVIEVADDLSPSIYKEKACEIARWWKRRAEAEFSLKVEGKNYQLKVKAPESATLLVRNCSEKPFFANYEITNKRDFFGEGILPGVALAQNSYSEWKDFIVEEGFLLIDEKHLDRAAFVIDGREKFDETKALQLLKEIDFSEKPVLRLWRWPDGCRSALCVTGDIDAMTLQDFFFRMWEM